METGERLKGNEPGINTVSYTGSLKWLCLCPHIFFSPISDGLVSVSCPKFGNEMEKNWKEFFECIEIRSKNDNFSCQQMIQVFKKIQLIYSALQDVVHDCPDYKVFQEEFIGRKQAKEIQSEIDRAQKRGFDLSFLPSLQRKIGFLKQLQEKHSRRPLFFRGDVQYYQRMLLRWIEEEFRTFLKSE